MGICGSSSSKPKCLTGLPPLPYNDEKFTQREIPPCPTEDDPCGCCYYEQKVSDFKTAPNTKFTQDASSSASTNQLWDFIVFHKDDASVYYIRFFHTGCKRAGDCTDMKKKGLRNVGHTSMMHDLTTWPEQNSQVKYGGEIKTLGGVVKQFNNKSGHLTPNGDFMDVIQTELGLEDAKRSVAFARYNEYGDFIGFGYRDAGPNRYAMAKAQGGGHGYDFGGSSLQMSYRGDYDGFERGFAAGMSSHQNQQSAPAIIMPQPYNPMPVQAQPQIPMQSPAYGTDPSAIMVVLAITLLSLLVCLMCSGAVAVAAYFTGKKSGGRRNRDYDYRMAPRVHKDEEEM